MVDGRNGSARLPVSVRVPTSLVYLFVIVLVYLAGIYLDRIYYFIYLVLLFVPILSAVQLLVTLVALHYHQSFDTEHPIKGESIGYRLTLANESFLASAPIRVRFKSIHPGLTDELPDLAISFAGNESVERMFSIHCPYRGIYTVGLERLEARDALGWLEVRRTVFHRTFYVYPRIIELSSPVVGSARQGTAAVSKSGFERDVALFEGLEPYREGLPVRHMAWKKFISSGTPFLKEYGRSAEPGVIVYLDLRRTEPLSARVLESEDCSLEITVALVKYFLESRVPVTVKAFGRDLYEFSGSDSSAFQRFYDHTINLLFQRTLSPAEVYESDRKRGAGGDAAVLFVTHLLDTAITDIVARSRDASVAAVVNEHAMGDEERLRVESYARSLRESGARIYGVRNAETIREDLTT